MYLIDEFSWISIDGYIYGYFDMIIIEIDKNIFI